MATWLSLHQHLPFVLNQSKSNPVRDVYVPCTSLQPHNSIIFIQILVIIQTSSSKPKFPGDTSLFAAQTIRPDRCNQRRLFTTTGSPATSSMSSKAPHQDPKRAQEKHRSYTNIQGNCREKISVFQEKNR